MLRKLLIQEEVYTLTSRNDRQEMEATMWTLILYIKHSNMGGTYSSLIHIDGFTTEEAAREAGASAHSQEKWFSFVVIRKG